MLDSAGHCAYCGGQARGFWADLDLGTPDLAAAVVDGLDYYLVLGVTPQAVPVEIAGEYHRARSRFPDDPRRLMPQVARSLGLIEEAWRILGVPERRVVYDRLRREMLGRTAAGSEVRTLRCSKCGAPFGPNPLLCSACGTARQAEAVPDVARPLGDIPDYYEALGLVPRLVRVPGTGSSRGKVRSGWQDLFDRADGEFSSSEEYTLVPPEPDEVEAAYLRRLEKLVFAADPEAEVTAEVARQVLKDPQRHQAYLSLRQQLSNPAMMKHVLESLAALDREVRSEIAGGPLAAADGAALIAQGRGLLRLNLHHRAVPVLEQACTVAPESAEAQYAYGMALWGSADLFALTGHSLRRIDTAFSAAQRLDPRVAGVVEPYILVTRGMLHFNTGEIAPAVEVLRQATQHHSEFAAGWRALGAALLQQRQFEPAIAACKQALRVEPNNERVLFLLLSAFLQTRQPDRVQAIALLIARLRGAGTTSHDVLREVGLVA